MNNLNLKGIGVKELTDNEMEETRGGFLGVILGFLLGGGLAAILFG
ncbi:hypothetical protein ACSBL2_26390 [Pedobacter sp. AW31-3R]